MKSDAFCYLFFWLMLDRYPLSILVWDIATALNIALMLQKVKKYRRVNSRRDTVVFPEQRDAEHREDRAMIECRWLNAQPFSSTASRFLRARLYVLLRFVGICQVSMLASMKCCYQTLLAGLIVRVVHVKEDLHRCKPFLLVIVFSFIVLFKIHSRLLFLLNF